MAVSFPSAIVVDHVWGRTPVILFAIFAYAITAVKADEGGRQHPSPLISVAETSPTLAPFQHVRFCLRYPADCTPDSAQNARIELDTQTSELLKSINHRVNLAIAPKTKVYGQILENSWTIAPNMGDCNDYAVTKRHELIKSGLPSSALRLSVTKTTSGEGHLVLLIATTKGDVVMDNLVEDIRPWHSTQYQWIKIQSAANPRFWNDLASLVPGLPPRTNGKLHVAGS